MSRKCTICKQEAKNVEPWVKSGLPTSLFTCENEDCILRAFTCLDKAFGINIIRIILFLLTESEDILTKDPNALNHHKAYDFIVSRLKALTIL